MMKNSISKRDWETISAYLDKQLSQKDQTRFESRLYNDRQLQVALDDLRQTRQVLRGAPKMRAPRNFLLTPEIAGSPVRIPRLAPVFGWASAVASFLLVLVLVGDFFTDGGFEPVDLITSQQIEFAVQQSDIPNSDIWTQPAISEDMGVSSKSVVESPQEAAPPENRAGVATMETAADEQIMESVLLEEETVRESQDSELLTMKNAAAEEPTPENSEEIASAVGEDESASDLAQETTVESSDGGSVEPQEAAEVMVQSSVDLTEDAAITDQVETEDVQESPTETMEMEEIPVQTMDEELEQPNITTAETVIIVDETYQEEQQTSDDSATLMVVEPMPSDTITQLETIPGTVTNPKDEGDLVLGVELILAMGALGTGLAWIYTRRRVG